MRTDDTMKRSSREFPEIGCGSCPFKMIYCAEQTKKHGDQSIIEFVKEHGLDVLKKNITPDVYGTYRECCERFNNNSGPAVEPYGYEEFCKRMKAAQILKAEDGTRHISFIE